VVAGSSRPVTRQVDRSSDGQAVSGRAKTTQFKDDGAGDFSNAARGAVFGVILGGVIWATLSILAVLM